MLSDNSLDSHQQYYSALLLKSGIFKLVEFLKAQKEIPDEEKLIQMVKRVTALVWVNWENPIHNMFSAYVFQSILLIS